jgi:histidinol-phosphatase (PHP family)
VLTDYHVHLRLDDLDASAAEHFTAANAERYRTVASERGIAELGVSEHVYRFGQALDVWRHPFWRENARDDLDAYCRFVREETDLRLGIEADYVPGREDRMASLLEARDFDYVIGSVHFVPLGGLRAGGRGEAATAAGTRAGGSGPGAGGTRAGGMPAGGFAAAAPESFGAVDMDEHGVWSSGVSAERIWRRYFETLGEAAGSGLFDILAHPDLVKVFGPRRPRPEGDLRRYYELALEGIARSGIAIEVSTAGLRKQAGEIYPAPAFLEMCLEAGAAVALSSDAHRASDLGAGYEQALELLDRVGVGEICVFDRRRRRLEPIGAA